MCIKGSSVLDSIFTIEDYINKKINGDSDQKIALDIYVSKNTLDRWKAKNKITKYIVNQKRFTIIIDMLNNGCTMTEIANKLKLTIKQCRNIKKQFEREYEKC